MIRDRKGDAAAARAAGANVSRAHDSKVMHGGGVDLNEIKHSQQNVGGYRAQVVGAAGMCKLLIGRASVPQACAHLNIVFPLLMPEGENRACLVTATCVNIYFG